MYAALRLPSFLQEMAQLSPRFNCAERERNKHVRARKLRAWLHARVVRNFLVPVLAPTIESEILFNFVKEQEVLASML